MDIEKPAPAGSVHYPPKKAATRAEAPKSHDNIDDFLAMNSASEQRSATRSSPTHIFKTRRHVAAKHSRRGHRVH